MNRFLRMSFAVVLGCGLCEAQRGGQQTGNQQPSGVNNQSQAIPLQILPLEDWPTSRDAAIANLRTRFLGVWHDKFGLWHFKNERDARFIWYKTQKSDSTALPVILVPMSCQD